MEIWSDGSYYYGNFENGVKEGRGVYFWADGSRYEGEWKQDEMSGTGVFQWADGRRFYGQFSKGVMHGYGEYVWQDGRKYEGFYKKNKKHGQGTYTYSNGQKYSGNWEDGMQHGLGRIIDADERFREGVWEQGKHIEWIEWSNFYLKLKPNFRGFVETNSSRQLNNVSSFVDPFLAVESFDPWNFDLWKRLHLEQVMPASRTRLVTAGFFDLPINASFVAASEPVMPHLKKNDFGDPWPGHVVSAIEYVAV